MVAYSRDAIHWCMVFAIVIIIIIMLPNQAIASTPSAPRPSVRYCDESLGQWAWLGAANSHDMACNIMLLLYR
jgi:hypothetical protein